MSLLIVILLIECSLFLHTVEWFHYYLIRLSLWLSHSVFPRGLSFTVSLFSALSLFSSSSSHTVSLQFSISDSACSLYTFFWCLCVCHSVKIRLTRGLVCFPNGDCSFILALASDGVYVSGKRDRWRSALKSNFMTLSNSERLRAYFLLLYVWI